MGAGNRRGFYFTNFHKISKIKENLFKTVFSTQIEIMDAARVKPGLNVVVNVKFSPIHEEEVMADIAFLTLSPDYDNKYHEFRVHVHCTPQLVQPILEPTELRLKIEAKIQIKYPLEIRFRNWIKIWRCWNFGDDRFPSAPIWKYSDPKLNERILTIYNNGKKPFSIVIEERKEQDHCFLWRFEQDIILSEGSSMLCISRFRYFELIEERKMKF